MTQNHSELSELDIVGVSRDGRRRYDPQAKRRLVEACLQPGASLASLELRDNVNANLLRKWVRKYQQKYNGGGATDVIESMPANAGTVPDRGALPRGRSGRSLPERMMRFLVDISCGTPEQGERSHRSRDAWRLRCQKNGGWRRDVAIAMIYHLKVSTRGTPAGPHRGAANLTAQLPVRPPPERGMWGAFTLAVMMHALLAAFLFYGIHWQSSPPVGAEAELWTAMPDMPTPRAKPAPTPEAPTEEGDIALQRKQRQERQAWLQAQLAERQRREQLMQQQMSKAQTRLQQQIDEERQARLKALQVMAGNAYQSGGSEHATAGPGSGGSASSSYADRVRRRVQPNIVFAGDTSLDISTLVAVDCAPDGHVLNARIVRPSGNPGWDDAAIRAVQRSDPMPLDDNGTAPAHFTITFRPRAS